MARVRRIVSSLFASAAFVALPWSASGGDGSEGSHQRSVDSVLSRLAYCVDEYAGAKLVDDGVKWTLAGACKPSRKAIECLGSRLMVVPQNTTVVWITQTCSIPWNDVVRIEYVPYDEAARPEDRAKALGSLQLLLKKEVKGKTHTKTVDADGVHESDESGEWVAFGWKFDSAVRLRNTVAAFRAVVSALGLKARVVEVKRGE